jgi:Trk K+ transport system NAD-binding subunit
MAENKNKPIPDLKNHFVMCNWTVKSPAIVRQLHEHTLENTSDMRDIVVITNDPDSVFKTKGFSQEKEFQKIYIVEGDPKNKEILKSAHADEAYSIIVLAEGGDSKVADANSILITLTIEQLCPQIHTVVEIMNSGNTEYFKYTKADEIICIEDLGERLIAQSALTPGLSTVFMDLMSQSETSEIYQVEVNEKMTGKTYKQIEDIICKNEKSDCILIGVNCDSEGKRKIALNPKDTGSDITKNYQLQKGDRLIVIAYDKPSPDDLI